MSTPDVQARPRSDAQPRGSAPLGLGLLLPRNPGVAGAIAIGGGVALAMLLGALSARGADVLAVGLAGLISLVVGLLAVTRFDLFVIVLLVVRSSLDVFGRGGLQGGAVDPTAAVGAVFVATATLWLAMRYTSGQWVRPSAATWALLALGGAGLASVINSPFRVSTVEGTFRLLAGVLMFAVLEQLLADERSPVRFIWALYASAVVPVAVGYLQVFTESGKTSVVEDGRAYGTFAHPNLLASYLVNLILLSLVVYLSTSGLLRRAAGAALLLGGPLLVFTYTRSAWFALVIGLIYLAHRVDRRIYVGLALAVVAVLVAAPSTISRVTEIFSPEETFYDGPSNSFQWRIDYWGEVLPLANDSPLTGIGLESTQRVTDARLPPHNTLVQTYVETGFLGCAAVIAVIVAFATLLHRRRLSARTALQRTSAVAAVAIGLALLVQAPSDNLLTRTSGYWYTALSMLYGLHMARNPTAGDTAPATDTGPATGPATATAAAPASGAPSAP